jgi:hypothetical protein
MPNLYELLGGSKVLTVTNIILSVCIIFHLICEFTHYIHEFISRRRDSKKLIDNNQLLCAIKKLIEERGRECPLKGGTHHEEITKDCEKD